MRKAGCFLSVIGIVACGPPKPSIPALTPEQAQSLLNYNSKAETWMIYVRKKDPTCAYRLDLPDQLSHPTSIDLDHIVYCGSRPGPKEYDASVSFVYDSAKQQWTVSRFSS